MFFIVNIFVFQTIQDSTCFYQVTRRIQTWEFEAEYEENMICRIEYRLNIPESLLTLHFHMAMSRMK